MGVRLGLGCKGLGFGQRFAFKEVGLGVKGFGFGSKQKFRVWG